MSRWLFVLVSLSMAVPAGAQGFTAWSSVNDPDGMLSVTSQAAEPSTSFGMQADFNNAGVSILGASVQDDTPAAETRYRARFYFDANNVDTGQAFNKRRIIMNLAQQGTTNFRMVAIILRQLALGGPYTILARTRLDDAPGTRVDFVSPDITPGSGYHWVEFDWQRATGDTTNDGRFTVWLDGVQFGQSTTLDNFHGGGGVDFARLGAMKLEQGANGTLYVDEFESRRQTQIGALP
jgi:hypothetical protein